METIIELLKEMPYPNIFYIGLAIRLIVGMRQFTRRGVAGLQHFPNYFVGVFILLVEFLLKWIGNAFMIYGLLGWLFT